MAVSFEARGRPLPFVNPIWLFCSTVSRKLCRAGKQVRGRYLELNSLRSWRSSKALSKAGLMFKLCCTDNATQAKRIDLASLMCALGKPVDSGDGAFARFGEEN